MGAYALQPPPDRSRSPASSSALSIRAYTLGQLQQSWRPFGSKSWEGCMYLGGGVVWTRKKKKNCPSNILSLGTKKKIPAGNGGLFFVYWEGAERERERVGCEQEE